MAHLKAVKDIDEKSTGDYECSICGERFRPNPDNGLELDSVFRQHVENKHKAQG